MIGVLVVEDSSTARELLLWVLRSDPGIRVLGEATNGLEAIALTKELRPDVITMDIRMPLLDGVEAIVRIMAEQPTPIVVVSASDVIEVETSMNALRAGALAVVEKPAGPATPLFEQRCRALLETVRLMAGVKVVRRFSERRTTRPAGRISIGARRIRAVAIATSTGGPAALQSIFSQLPGDFPAPVLVVQHISQGFTAGLAAWLGATSRLRVKVAEAEEAALPGAAYLAPDGAHLGLTRGGRILISSAPRIDGFRPSATFLFESLAGESGGAIVALILTGMGRDGVDGLRRLKAAGGHVIAQDETSSVVFGMPAAAIDAGVADEVVALEQMAGRLTELVAS